MFAKFKDQLNQRFEKISIQVTETRGQVNHLKHSIEALQTSSNRLQSLLPEINEFQTDLQRSVDKFNFKSQPRIDKIKTHVDAINHELAKYQRK